MTGTCVHCGRPWPANQLVYCDDDGVWVATCSHCGHRQEWTWVAAA